MIKSNTKKKGRTMEKETYMKQALKEAQKAYDKAEVPIGVVIVKERKNNSQSTQHERNKKRHNRTRRNKSNKKSK